MDNFQGKTAKSNWWGEVRLLTAEEELELTQVISTGRDLFNKDDSELSSSDKKTKRLAIRATHRLVEAYALLIEKIARENFNSVENNTIEYDDFIAEAYIVAFQCAKNFNPGKSSNQIRFSSYVSRAISSSLFRMAMKSRTSLYVPTATMSKARKWVHTYFEMVNKGLNISDEDVSTISCVNLTQQEAREVLEISNSASIDEIEHPSITDNPILEEEQNYKDIIKQLIENNFGEDSYKILLILGVEKGRALFSSFLLSAQLEENSEELEEFMIHFRSILNHPLVRMKIKDDLENMF